MKRLLLLALLGCSFSAYAQDDDAPIPYPDDEEEEAPSTRRKKLPRRSEETYVPREETEEEERERERPLAGTDDPNVGFAGEFVIGALFADAANGQFPSASPGFGVRATWEVGRTVLAEQLRESLFADLTWLYSSSRRGTTEVFGDSNYHFFTLAPAYAFPFGPNRMFAGFLQAGAGITYNATGITVKDTRTEVAGVKPVIQYGLGIRGTPVVNPELPLRISFRVEVTRFRRGYSDDTFVGGSVGVDF